MNTDKQMITAMPLPISACWQMIEVEKEMDSLFPIDRHYTEQTRRAIVDVDYAFLVHQNEQALQKEFDLQQGFNLLVN